MSVRPAAWRPTFLTTRIAWGIAIAGCTSTPPDKADSDPPQDTLVVHTDTETVPHTDAPVLHTSELLSSGPIDCARPRTSSRNRYERIEITRAPAPSAHLEGAGSAVGDFDGDGILDVIAVLHSEVILLRHAGSNQDLDVQVLHTNDAGSTITGLFGASAADLDGDGDLDVLITGRGVANVLLINDGDGTFHDGTAASGLGVLPDEHHSAAASWIDLDGDADLDLFIAGHGYVDEDGTIPTFSAADPSALFRNQGDGTFADISHLIPQPLHDGYTFLGGWLDADGDGDDDLYMVNDFGGNQRPCSLVLREGDVFTADDNAASIDARKSGMGLAIGDFNGDGLEDLAVPAWRNHALYARQGAVWFDITNVAGFTATPPQTVAWGAEFLDVDNNGLMDLSVAFGFLETGFGDNNGLEQADAMFVQLQPGALTDQANAGEFADVAAHRSINPADLDGDGWLDFVKVGLDGVVRLFLSRCDDTSWLTVRLHQQGMNRHGIGATVYVSAGDRTWMRRLRAGGTGYATSGPPQLHFGLGDVERVDTLRVHWPDGEEEVWQDVEVHQHLDITRR